MPDVRVPAKAGQKPYDSLVKKQAKGILFQGSRFLVLLGKPLFIILSLLILVCGFVVKGLGLLFFLTGKSVLEGVGLLCKLRLHQPHSLTRPHHKPARTYLFNLRELALVIIIIIFSWGILSWSKFIVDLPQPGQLITRRQPLSTKIYDRKGNLLFKVYRNENRTLLPLSEMPVFLRLATVAIEDAEFYSHHGFSLKGILRAMRQNLTKRELVGGSTITQQLVKNAFLSPEKTLSRKVKEVVLAIRVELEFNKDQILEMYLNEVSYGHSAYGVEEASELYFGKSARSLTLAESALLAGLPKAPTAYSPFGANPELAKARQAEVLSRMVQEKFITPQQKEEAVNEKLVFAPQKTDIQAPHFVMYVKQLLAETFGERMVEEGGLEVITSLDLDIQKIAEKVLSTEIQKVSKLRISNGAVLITSPKTGEILAMVGSRDYFDQKIDGNFNVTTALRQPGSSIKPVNYAYALESRRYTPASIISDTPITYSVPGNPPYSPKNYNNTFHGPVSIRTALASSLNVPAVKVLASYGVPKMVELGKKMGISSWGNRSYFGLTTTLGSAEVKMTEMAVVYGVLANNGERVDLRPILKVRDHVAPLRSSSFAGCGRDIDTDTDTENNGASERIVGCSRQVLDRGVAFLLTDILRDNQARTLAFGPNSLLVIPNHSEVAVKTGTTQNLRDNWAIGYTKDFVVVTWVGNNNNVPMSYVASGVTGATPIWHNVMTTLLKDSASTPWELPQDVTLAKTCLTGGRIEYFLVGTEPHFVCTPSEKAEEKDRPAEG
ncbi:MAG: PBP1A family penicillin-binding protein [Candidatus Blackburnbacteria bacterium]|nr:PBP1A family penicillin-binding protein [Candidatus Blackburnbacteria bacterium]